MYLSKKNKSKTSNSSQPLSHAQTALWTVKIPPRKHGEKMAQLTRESASYRSLPMQNQRANLPPSVSVWLSIRPTPEHRLSCSLKLNSRRSTEGHSSAGCVCVFFMFATVSRGVTISVFFVTLQRQESVWKRERGEVNQKLKKQYTLREQTTPQTAVITIEQGGSRKNIKTHTHSPTATERKSGERVANPTA